MKDTDPSLATLVDMARAGDRDAFGTLYERHVRLVNAVLLGLIPHDDAADAAQDVFLSALRRLPELRDASAFPGWIAMIARNRAKMFLRSRVPLEPLSGAEVATDLPVDARLDAARVLAHVRELPEKLRGPLLLRLVEGLSGEEIADMLGLSHGTVRVYLHEGMGQLRQRLHSQAKHVVARRAEGNQS